MIRSNSSNPPEVRAADGATIVANRDFCGKLDQHHLSPLQRDVTTILQVNLGKKCNQACSHCHVEAGPLRTEMMNRRTAQRIIDLLQRSPKIEMVDLTGGAPELNPHFRWLVEQITDMGIPVIDRCNLTILLEEGMEDLASFLARHRVHIIASLPCYSRENVDSQRGGGVYDRSIEALQRLHSLGYGKSASGLLLDLVYNPSGAQLPPPREELERDYRQQLLSRHGIEFSRLLTLANLPIRRFATALARSGELEEYLDLLEESFNSATVSRLMCRNTISIGWDGLLYDCDFNQMLDLQIKSSGGPAATIFDIDHFDRCDGRPIVTGGHCFGCTAGHGSSCSGTLV